MADVMEVKRGIFGASISWNDIINQKDASQSLKKTVNCFMLHISGISRPKVGSIVDVNLLITIVFDIKGKF